MKERPIDNLLRNVDAWKEETERIREEMQKIADASEEEEEEEYRKARISRQCPCCGSLKIWKHRDGNIREKMHCERCGLIF